VCTYAFFGSIAPCAFFGESRLAYHAFFLELHLAATDIFGLYGTTA
jgi:hypothetical protein